MEEGFRREVGCRADGPHGGDEVVFVDQGRGVAEVGPKDDADNKSDESQYLSEISLLLLFWGLQLLITAEALYWDCEEISEEEDGHSSSCSDCFDS
jgi:hypothetical protein